jgi:NAD(P)-dependent dehydrogenase (short-subunit alcohol dehydrogenase family)
MPLKTTVITGATSGIGKETAWALAQKGHAVYMLVRNVAKGEAVRSELLAQGTNLEIHVIECDLTNLASVKAAAETLKDKLFGINVLINNAGGIFAERELSTDGFEMTFAMNHLGHFMLTQCLMPLLERGQARIINLSSEGHKMGKPEFNDLQAEKGYSAMRAYGTAKLFNIYFTKSLAEKYKSKGITAFAVHPGLVKTSFGKELNGFEKLLMWLAKPFMISAAKGAETSVYLATQPKLDSKSGQYFKNKKVVQPANNANNEAARNQLWDISAALISPFLK